MRHPQLHPASRIRPERAGALHHKRILLEGRLDPTCQNDFTGINDREAYAAFRATIQRQTAEIVPALWAKQVSITGG